MRAKAALALALDDQQRSVSAPDGRLLAAESERVRLPNTSPNFRARALSRSFLTSRPALLSPSPA